MPCDERSSFECGLKTREVTWEGVTSELRRAELVVFQKWMVRSDDPPPEARREAFQGHQARAWLKREEEGQGRGLDGCERENSGQTLTAAVWFVLHILGAFVMRPSQTLTTLSFPPLARSC
jgi:hypothetical protein